MSSRDDQLHWFHGKLTRESAEDLIKKDGKEDGTFLVRESNTATGDFVLTLLYQNEVCHYQIRRHGEDAFFSIDDKVKILHGLDTLVEFYQQGANGLITKLTIPIKKEPPPNCTRRHGATNLLHRATKENNQTVVSELLKCGYRNFDAKNQDGQTAVHLACLYCDETILTLLLNAGVNVNCMDTSGYAPLHYACRNKSASFIKILINANANIQGRNIKNGNVSLHEAAKYGNLDAVRELLNANAPPMARTNCGEFPIDLARENNHTAVVEYLTNFKPRPVTTNQTDWYHGTLKREEAVAALLTFAANKEATTKSHSNASTTTTTTNNNDSLTDIENSNGCFLVRYSESQIDESRYVLTLLWNKDVKHYRISQTSKYYYIDDGPYVPSLEHLIEHFMKFSDGLPVCLKYPVRPAPKPPLPLFSTMPRTTYKKKDNSKNAIDGNYNRDHHHASLREAPNLKNSDQHSLTLNIKKKRKENPVLHIATLLRSPKKNIIIADNAANQLKKHKFNETKKDDAPPQHAKQCHNQNNEHLKEAESLFKNLSFSTEFSTKRLDADNTQKQRTIVASSPMVLDGLYNVPMNNQAILDNESPRAIYNNAATSLESKTDDDDVEYFTKSDIDIERERMNAANEPAGNCAQQFKTNANGYIPTVDIRVFLDPLTEPSKEAIEASAAELRDISDHPERLDSLISITSTDSYVMRFFNRQISTTSSIGSTNAEAATAITPGTPTQLKVNYFIPSDCLQLGAIIGEGEFGSVYRGSLIRSTNEHNGNEIRCEVAIKTLRDEHCRTNKQQFLREASVMIRLQHHCIVKLIGISKGKSLMMVQELVPLGSMLEYILENKESINPNYELKLWASQIACGMQYLESQHFVHRDLAARNILLASRNQAKISDFGLSRALSSGNDCYQSVQGGKWPIKWYAPESFRDGLFSHASDVWSYGITLWEMFSLGAAPYDDMRGVETIKLIENGERLPQPQLCPNHVYEIMKSCWNYKPKDRPTFRYLTEFFAKHPDYENIMELIKTEHIS